MVTAIKFKDEDEASVIKYSAKTFIEINTTQTPIRTTHLDAIRYPILGDTQPRAIAAQVILKANESKTSLYGIFDTNQTSLGIIQTTTVLTALKTITHLEMIRNLREATKGARARKRQGYENLFECRIDDICQVENLIEKGSVCFVKYFNYVARVFSHDWPRRGQDNSSSLKFAKVIAGFVKLLGRFIAEGLEWKEVKVELEKIRTNIMQLRRMNKYNKVLFDPTHKHIPNAQPSATNDYRFLTSNRRAPTSIQEVIVLPRIKTKNRSI